MPTWLTQAAPRLALLAVWPLLYALSLLLATLNYMRLRLRPGTLERVPRETLPSSSVPCWTPCSPSCRPWALPGRPACASTRSWPCSPAAAGGRPVPPPHGAGLGAGPATTSRPWPHRGHGRVAHLLRRWPGLGRAERAGPHHPGGPRGLDVRRGRRAAEHRGVLAGVCPAPGRGPGARGERSGGGAAPGCGAAPRHARAGGAGPRPACRGRGSTGWPGAKRCAWPGASCVARGGCAPGAAAAPPGDGTGPTWPGRRPRRSASSCSRP